MGLLAKINDHGCWCGATTTIGHIAPHKGRPIDYTDKSCRDWMTCQHCNKNLNQDCVGSESYHVLFNSNDNTWSCSSNTNNNCSENRCQCDLHLAMNIFETVSELEDLHLVTDPSSECVVGGNSNSPYKKNKCCGVAPFYEKYSDVMHV